MNDLNDFYKSLGIKPNEDILYHAGVLGMKWGVRKPESDARIARDKTSSKKKSKKSTVEVDSGKRNNTLSKNPKNRRMSDAELQRAINRLDLEKRYAQLTAPQQKKVDSFIKEVLKTSSKQILTNTLTELGGSYLKRYTKVNINKRVPSDYRIS